MSRFYVVLLFTACLGGSLYASTWDGGGGDTKFSNALNWLDDKVPIDGADLMFPQAADDQTLTNDLPAKQFHRLYIHCKNLILQGNEIVTDQIDCAQFGGAQGRIELNMPLSSNGQLAFFNTAGVLIDISGPINDGPSGVCNVFLQSQTGGSYELNGLDAFGGNKFTGFLQLGISTATDSVRIVSPLAVPPTAVVNISQGRLVLNADVTCGTLIGSGAVDLDVRTLTIGTASVLPANGRANSYSGTFNALNGSRIRKIGDAGYTLNTTINGACAFFIDSGSVTSNTFTGTETAITLGRSAVFNVFAGSCTSLTVGPSAALFVDKSLTCNGLLDFKPDSVFSPRLMKDFTVPIEVNDANLTGASVFPRGTLNPNDKIVFLKTTGTAEFGDTFGNASEGKSVPLLGGGGATVSISYKGDGTRKNSISAFFKGGGKGPGGGGGGNPIPVTPDSQKKPSKTTLTGPLFAPAGFTYTIKARTTPVLDCVGGTHQYQLVVPLPAGLQNNQAPQPVVLPNGDTTLFENRVEGTYTYQTAYSGNAILRPSVSNQITVNVGRWPTVIRFSRQNDVLTTTLPFTLKEDLFVVNNPLLSNPGSPFGTVALKIKKPDATEQVLTGVVLNPLADGIRSMARFETPVLPPGAYELLSGYEGDLRHLPALNRQRFIIAADGSLQIPDGDGDGLNDQVTAAALADSQLGFTIDPLAPSGTFTVKTLKAGINVGTTPSSNDTLSFSGEIEDFGRLSAKQAIVVAIGDSGAIVRSFVVDGKGKSTSSSKDKFSISAPKNGISKFTVTLAKSTLGAALLQSGFPLSSSTPSGKQDLPLAIYRQNGSFSANASVEFTVSKALLKGKLAKVVKAP